VKKPFLFVAFVLACLLSVMVISGFVGLAEANPHAYPAYGGTFSSQLIIPIASPQNNTVYTTNNIAVIFNVNTPERTGVSYLLKVYYTADWLPKDVIVYLGAVRSNRHTFTEHTEHNATYVIPDGEHNLTIVATGEGGTLYSEKWYSFEMAGVSVINFTIDTTPPKISVLSLENKTYNASDALLDFALNEPVSQISYVLDGGENLTIECNTTLTDLPNGEHNVTVYATDLAGNVGSSETITFTVAKPDPFPTALVIAAFVIVAVIVVAGLLVYFKKRNHHGEQPRKE
jgi:hypothetical protein